MIYLYATSLVLDVAMVVTLYVGSIDDSGVGLEC